MCGSSKQKLYETCAPRVLFFLLSKAGHVPGSLLHRLHAGVKMPRSRAMADLDWAWPGGKVILRSVAWPVLTEPST